MFIVIQFFEFEIQNKVVGRTKLPLEHLRQTLPYPFLAFDGLPAITGMLIGFCKFLFAFC